MSSGVYRGPAARIASATRPSIHSGDNSVWRNQNQQRPACLSSARRDRSSCAPEVESYSHPPSGCQRLPACDVPFPLLTEALLAGDPRVRQVDRQTDRVPGERWVLVERRRDRVAELGPLRTLDLEEVLCLPSPLAPVRVDPVPLDTPVRRAVPDEPRACRGGLLGRELAAEFLKAVIGGAPDGADDSKVH